MAHTHQKQENFFKPQDKKRKKSTSSKSFAKEHPLFFIVYLCLGILLSGIAFLFLFLPGLLLVFPISFIILLITKKAIQKISPRDRTPSEQLGIIGFVLGVGVIIIIFLTAGDWGMMGTSPPPSLIDYSYPILFSLGAYLLGKILIKIERLNINTFIKIIIGIIAGSTFIYLFGGFFFLVFTFINHGWQGVKNELTSII